DFLLKITAKDISTTDNRLATEIMHSVSDFEKIGDYCGSLAQEAELHHEQNVTFSADGQREFSYAAEAVRAIISMTVQAYQEENPVIAARVEPLEQTVDLMEETLKSKHIERLQSGACSTKSGITFVEVLNDMDRIASHCANIALHLTQRLSSNGSFDAHAHVRDAHDELSDEYKALCHYYESKYLEPVR
ncbi:MAG: Na/Pi cotransporter family protein, partial [Clostridia bacterium]|nr:Na/Pi cotransporter family protein [Clostridia bacterium]